MERTLMLGVNSTSHLFIAAKSASKDVIGLLFKLGASTEYGQPLHFAVSNDRPNEIILLFFEKGA